MDHKGIRLLTRCFGLLALIAVLLFVVSCFSPSTFVFKGDKSSTPMHEMVDSLKLQKDMSLAGKVNRGRERTFSGQQASNVTSSTIGPDVSSPQSSPESHAQQVQVSESREILSYTLSKDAIDNKRHQISEGVVSTSVSDNKKPVVEKWKTTAENIPQQTALSAPMVRSLARIVASPIGNLQINAGPEIYYPDGDGFRDSLKISAAYYQPVAWEVVIADKNLQIVFQKKLGVANSINFDWDGKTSTGRIPEKGLYYAITVATLDNDDVASDYKKILISQQNLATPDVAILSPAAGLIVKADSILVRWTRYGQIDSSFEKLPYEGKHSIVRKIIKDAVIHADSINVIVDRTSPVVAFISPKNDTTIKTANLTVQWKVSDIGSGIDSIFTRLISFKSNDSLIIETYTDLAGFISLDSIRVSVDSMGPLVKIIQPATDTLINVSRVKLSWTVDGVLFSRDTTLGEGAHTLAVRAADSLGNIATDSVRVTVDFTSPTVIITSPSKDTLVNRTPLTIGYSVDGEARSRQISLQSGSNVVIIDTTDKAGNRGADTVRITLNDQGPIVVITSPVRDTIVNTPRFVVHWIVNKVLLERSFALNEGANGIIIDTTDETGNYAADTVNITLDTLPPVVVITSPSDSLQTKLSPVTVAYTVDGTPATRIVILQEGTNTIIIDTTDAAFNHGSDTIHVTLDTHAPAVVITCPSKDTLINLISFAVAYTVEGEALSKIFTLSDGSNLLVVDSIDAAGNRGADSVTVTVDRNTPEATITAPSDGLVFDTASVAFGATFSGNNLSAVQLVIDGIDRISAFSHSGSDYSARLNLNHGYHTFIAIARNTAGGADTEKVSFKVSTERPKTEVLISGWVYDGRLLTGLENVTVRVKETGKNVLTNAEGKFELPSGGFGKFTLDVERTGYTNAMRFVSADSGLDPTVSPILIIPRDTTTVMIIPGRDTTVSLHDSVQIHVPSGALAQPLQVSSTLLNHISQLPNEQPGQDVFMFSVDLQPHGAHFADSITVRVPNRAELTPGLDVPITYFNETTGLWDSVGIGLVTADGASIEFRTNHFSCFHANNHGANGDDSTDQDCDCDCPTDKGSTIGILTGDLGLDFTVPSGASLANLDATLAYRSRTACPSTPLSTYQRSIATTPTYTNWSISIGGINRRWLFSGATEPSRQTYIWDGKNAEGKELETGVYTYGVRYNRTFMPGRYRFSLDRPENFQITYQTPVNSKAHYYGFTTLINRKSSPYGAGWTIGGVTRIVGKKASITSSFPQTSSYAIMGGGYRSRPTGGTMVYDPSSTSRALGKTKGSISGDHISIVGLYAETYWQDDNFKNIYLSSSGQDTLFREAGGWNHYLSNGETHEYDNRGILTRKTDKFGHRTIYSYDSFGERLQRITDETTGAYTSFSYDGRGLLNRITDQFGRSTNVSIDGNGNLIQAVLPDGKKKSFAYDGNHRATHKQLENGYYSDYEFDKWGFITKAKHSSGEEKTYCRRFDNSILNDYEPIADTLADLLGTPTFAVIGGGGNGGTGIGMAMVDNGTSQLSSLKKNIMPRDVGTNYGFVDKNGHGNRYIVNPSGNVTQHTDTKGNITRYTYNNSCNCGSASAVEYPNGMTINRTTDARGNLLSTTNSVTGATTSYTYTTIGHTDYVQTVTNAAGQTTRFAYDNIGNLTKIIAPGQDTTAISYNSDGLPVTITDPLHRTVSMAYDSRGRVTRRTSPKGDSTTYVYDSYGNLSIVTDPRGRTTRYEYDIAGRLLKSIDPAAQETRYTYDNGGNLASVIDPKGHSTTFTYNTSGKLTKSTNQAGVSRNYDYDEQGHLTSYVNARGDSIGYRYDELGRLIEKLDPQKAVFARFGYDDMGNMTYAGTPEYTVNRRFDQAGRMIQEEINRILERDTLRTGGMIAADDFSKDYTHLVINGDSVVIDGEHHFLSLSLRNGAKVRHVKTDTMAVHHLAIFARDSIVVDATSSIDVTGLGYLGAINHSMGETGAGWTNGNTRSGGSGPGSGGSHGGKGDIYVYSAGPVPSADIYDNRMWPTLPGGGGGGHIVDYQGSGGGVIHLNAPVVRIDGGVRANGNPTYDINGGGYGGGGAGAGGSIIIEAEQLSGSGSISADGGSQLAGHSDQRAGGGGRIFVSVMQKGGQGYSAAGGSGGNGGGDGTVIVKIGDSICIAPVLVTSGRTVTIGKSDESRDEAEITVDSATIVVNGNHKFRKLVLRNHALLTHDSPRDSTDVGVNLTIADSIVMDATSRIDLTGKGFAGDSIGRCPQTDRFKCFATGWSGGSHGGIGGAVTGTAAPSFGSIIAPSTFGGGGATDDILASASGGNGGGHISITTPLFRNDGTIVASGVSGISGGGGAGGSVLIIADTLKGTGTISAEGAWGGFEGGGGGGGGRIAVRKAPLAKADIGRFYVRAGRGTASGTAGTLYIESLDTTIQDTSKGNYANVIFVNSQTKSLDAENKSLDFSNVTLNSSSLTFYGDHEFDTLILNSSSLSTYGKIKASYVRIGSSSTIYIDDTLDAGTVEIMTGGTLTHHNVWFNRDTMFTWNGHLYGILRQSTPDWESAELYAKRMGGHLVTLNSKAEEDTIYNRVGRQAYFIGLKSPARPTYPEDFRWISSEQVFYTNWKSGQPDNDPANGNYVCVGFDAGQTWWHNVANGGWSGRPVLAVYEFDDSTKFRRSINRVCLVSDVVRIYSGGKIDVTGKGYPAGYRINGDTVITAYAGGTHGGRGSGSTDSLYGSTTQPEFPGSGAGKNYVGAAGGGTIRIIASRLQLDGSIVADGQSNGGTYNVGGAGGSVWTTADTITGIGFFYARGGISTYRGGGGRVALYTNSIDGQVLMNVNVTGYEQGTAYLFGPKSISRLEFTGSATIPFSLTNMATIQNVGEVIVKAGASVNVALPGIVRKLTVDSLGTLILLDTLRADTLIVKNSGTVTHSNSGRFAPKFLSIVSNYVNIKSGGKIDVAGKGYPTGYTLNGDTASMWQPAAGSHGGYGGGTNSPTYDSHLTPTLPGAGGSYPTTTYNSAGGGVVRLIAGFMQLDGSIVANGISAGWTSGSGAGGSIWISADSIRGNGTINAQGGPDGGNFGDSRNGYAGGGGRIAVYSPVMTGNFLNNLSVWGYQSGTIYLQRTGIENEVRIVDNTVSIVDVSFADSTTNLFVRNNGKVRIASNTILSSVKIENTGTLYIHDTLFCDSLVVESGGTVSHYGSGRFTPERLTIIADYINIKNGGKIDVAGKGYPTGYTLNGDTASMWQPAAGSHGGYGGGTNSPTYDSHLTPTLPGAGGSYPTTTYNSAGGGVVRLIAGLMQLDGSIVANGISAGWTSGSGAGGSIWISADSIRGNGTINAQGGPDGGNFGDSRNGYAGGGGRIAVYSPVMTGNFLNNLSVWGYQSGTIYLQRTGIENEVRIVDNTVSIVDVSFADSTTNLFVRNNGKVRIASNTILSSVKIENTGTLYIHDTLFCDSLVVESGGTVSHYGSGRFTPERLTIIADYINIKNGGKIDVAGKGYPTGYTLNGDTASMWQPAAGSHGGYGGGTNSPTYDSHLTPTLPGAGGSYPTTTYNSAGGGVVRLIAGFMQLDGSIVANGISAGWTSGSGAGGSIWISADSIRGNGTINAQGGPDGGNFGDSRNGYAGGGGRIAVYSPVMTGNFLNNLSVWGYQSGTIYLQRTGIENEVRIVDNTVSIVDVSFADSTTNLFVRNNGKVRIASNTILSSVKIENTGTLYIHDTLFCDSLVVESGGTVSHYGSGRFTPERLTIIADYINIKNGGKIDVAGKGYPTGYTLNGDTASMWQPAAGSHGGYGGGTNSPTYDSHLTPTLPGAGGSYPTTTYNSAGGGVVRLIAGLMQLDGSIVANGISAGWTSGSGAGGSIWISADSIRGNGTINAQGGPDGGNFGDSRNGYAGGGGRIAIYSPVMTGTFLNNFSVWGYQQGTIYLENSIRDTIILDGYNGATPILSISPTDTSFDGRNLTLKRGARIVFQARANLGNVKVLGHSSLTFSARTSADTLTIDSSTVSLIDDTLKANEILVNSGGNLTHLPTSFSFEEPDSLVTWNGHVYGSFKQTSPNWQYAENYAKKRGGHLVTIENDAEALYLYGKFPMPAWIGLSTNGATDDPSDYYWSSGSSSGYTNWKSGQPDLKSAQAKYAIMGYDFGSSQWHNVENTGWNGKPVYGIYEVDHPDSLKIYQPMFNKATVVANHIRVYPGGTIDVSGKGYPAGFTANADSLTASAVAGGSHAGKGQGTSGSMYGNYRTPELPGAGGGIPTSGKAGGGVLRLASHVLQVEGTIKADGLVAEANKGAGAGGSIWISSDTIVGDGSISANGGSLSGTGLRAGGGRIAVYGKLFSGAVRGNIAASGYSAGTVFMFDSIHSIFGTLILDNKGTTASDSSTLVTSLGTGTASRLTDDTLVCDTCHFPVYHKEVPGLRRLTLNVNPLARTDLTTQFNIRWHDSTRIVVDTTGGRSLQAKISVGGRIEGIINLDTLFVRGGARGVANDPVIYNNININSGRFADPYSGLQIGGLFKWLEKVQYALGLKKKDQVQRIPLRLAMGSNPSKQKPEEVAIEKRDSMTKAKFDYVSVSGIIAKARRNAIDRKTDIKTDEAPGLNASDILIKKRTETSTSNILPLRGMHSNKPSINNYTAKQKSASELLGMLWNRRTSGPTLAANTASAIQSATVILADLKTRSPVPTKAVSMNVQPTASELLAAVRCPVPAQATVSSHISEIEVAHAVLDKYRESRKCLNRREPQITQIALMEKEEKQNSISNEKTTDNGAETIADNNSSDSSASISDSSVIRGQDDVSLSSAPISGISDISGSDIFPISGYVSRFIDREERMKKRADDIAAGKVVQLVCYGTDPVYTYDALNRRTSMRTPFDTSYYDYDATTGRLSAIRKADGRKFDFSYSHGQLVSMAMPNGVTSSYSFDDNGNLTAIDYDKGASRVAQFHYGYDADGMRTSMTDNDGTHDYGYDALYQITSVTHPRVQDPTESFKYDAVGNRLEDVGGSAYRYDDLNRLLEDNEFTYTYDLDGNMTRKMNKSTSEITTFSFSIENKLVKIERGLHTTTFTYDALGRRVAKVHDGAAREYRYDGQDLIMEFNGRDSLLASYTFGPGIDRTLEMKRGTQRYYYVTDGLGSVCALTNVGGNIVQKYKYSVFGNMVLDSGGVENPFRYTAREWDGEVGLYYYRARFYDARVGRFVSEDPIGIRGSINIYKYVSNSPIVFMDPLGLKEKEGLIDKIERWGPEILPDWAGVVNDVRQTAQAAWNIMTGDGTWSDYHDIITVPIGYTPWGKFYGLGGAIGEELDYWTDASGFWGNKAGDFWFEHFGKDPQVHGEICRDFWKDKNGSEWIDYNNPNYNENVGPSTWGGVPIDWTQYQE